MGLIGGTIYTSNFGFLRKITDLKSHNVEVDDILIQKEIMERESILKKIFKNGNAQVNYKPTQFVSFAIN